MSRIIMQKAVARGSAYPVLSAGPERVSMMNADPDYVPNPVGFAPAPAASAESAREPEEPAERDPDLWEGDQA